MTNGGWQRQPSQRHGRHWRGSSGTAWTPSTRPRESEHTTAHAGPHPVPGQVRPGLTPAQSARPPASQEAVRSDLDAPMPSQEPAGPDPGGPALSPALTTGPEPAWPDPDPAWDLGAPPMSSLPTAPLSLTRIREERERQQRDEPIVHALPPETPPSGLRKFDLGTVPASVTPPRSWRKAAWFAVGTSAAVMVGLAYAAVEFVGKPGDPPLIEALPDYPTRPWNIEQLPAERTTNAPDRPVSDGGPQTSSSAHNPDTSVGDSPVETPDAPGTPGSRPTSRPGGSTPTPAPTEPSPPSRTTVSPAPLVLANPQKMGDVTEAYYALVTDDPEAAHRMTAGRLAREGVEGIKARYEGVERVEVQEISINCTQAVTTSTVKLVHEDGTETIEQRHLTFTWGGNPKITDEATRA